MNAMIQTIKPIDKILSALEARDCEPKRIGVNGYKSLCPCHNDHKSSLSITETNDGTVLLHCHANASCATQDIVSTLGLQMKDLFSPSGRSGKFEITATYDYRDESGNLLFQVCRTHAKKFPVRRPDGKGGWIWGLDKTRRVLYRLPEIIKKVKAGETIWICEGEKDVDNLWAIGLPATCNLGGAGKWKDEYSEFLRGACVVILPDNDSQGREHAQDVAQSFRAIASEVRILELSNLPEKGDVSDFLMNSGTGEQLLTLAKTAPVWTPKPDNDKSVKDTLPTIRIKADDLKGASDSAWDLIKKVNKCQPFLFSQGGLPVRIEKDENEKIIIVSVGEVELRHHLIRYARWIRVSDGQNKPKKTHPSKLIIEDVLAIPNISRNLLPLKRVIDTPVFTHDGTLINTPGYHKATGIYYTPVAGFRMPAISQNPSTDEVVQAYNLVNDLFYDFPVVNEAELAHIYALLVLPFVREMIDGCTPLHLIEKSTPGTGATLLAAVVCGIATGKQSSTIAEGRDADEWRKRLTASLRNSPTFIVIDNLQRRLDSSALSLALTSPTWEDRILGASRNISVPIRCTWVATGNNPALSSEISRRTIRIRLDAKCDKPWLRLAESFKHPDLRVWVDKHRPELVWAVCTIIQSWIAKGKPLSKKSLGMFESWAQVMGGILESAGIDGFLENVHEFYEQSDQEATLLREFISSWYHHHKKEPVTTTAIYDMIDQSEIPCAFFLGKGAKNSQKTRLGIELGKLRDRYFTIDCTDNVTRTVTLMKSQTKSHGLSTWFLKVIKETRTIKK